MVVAGPRYLPEAHSGGGWALISPRGPQWWWLGLDTSQGPTVVVAGPRYLPEAYSGGGWA